MFKHFVENLLIVLLALFAPIQAAMLATLSLIGLDLVVGIYAAHKRGEPIRSAAIRRTLSKIFVYETAIAVAFIGEKYLIGDFLPLVKLVTGLIGLTEIRSLYENLSSISGDDVFKQIVAKLGSANDEALKK